MKESENSELFRYVEYLQSGLISEGSETFISNERDWFINSRSKIKKSLQEKLGGNDDLHPLAKKIEEFNGSTKFESFFPMELFKPILDDVTEIYKEIGVTVSATVDLFTSPSMSPGPCALPSIHGHSIFAGEGTMSFCNYWSKIFVSIAIGCASTGKADFSDQSINNAIADYDIGIKAFCLAAYYSQCGSLRGFGKLEEPEGASIERASLVQAMEVFIIAHEFYHLYLEEQYPIDNGVPPDTTEKEMELMCDSFALVVTTMFGIKRENINATHLIAPLVFFLSLDICESARSKLKPNAKRDDSHPSPIERVENINEFIQAGDFPDYMKDSFELFIRISGFLGKRVDTLIEAISVEKYA
ncbi:hypothetical protein C4G66_RS25000 [Vibrio parahaemolyticus]|nr:hypothetical protein [Vibrio parahaemolyticus]EJG1072163.1 hypothetical protein [Vibrio parahaemolyticus]